jgi:hypothetical protein
MARRRFSKQPKVGAGSRAPTKTIRGQLPQAVQKFKNTYVFERRVLEQFRSGGKATYKPSPTLDGKSNFDTPEEKQKLVSAWEQAFQKLSKCQDSAEPSQFVRILFYILRGSSVSVPTVSQLASPNMLGTVSDFLQERVLSTRQQFVAESQRAQSAIRLNQKGAGYPLGLSVYYAIVDSRIGLSPLFRYCLANETARQLKARKVESENCEKLDRLAKQFELFAAMDYTLFPETYNEVWGSVIPSAFRVAAFDLLETALAGQ